MNVLIAEDEPHMRQIIAAYFRREGFQTFEAKDGEEALHIMENETIHLAVLDWMMPKIDGIEVCKYIKKHYDTKVLILTAKSHVHDEIEALHIGADDYVKKPFEPQLLLIRAKKLIRYHETIKNGALKIVVNEKKVYKGDELLTLTKIEYDLLVAFINNKGIILSRDRLIDSVWGMDYEGDYRTVDTHIRRLRTKIGENMIKTYRGLGYSMEVTEYKAEV